MKIKDLKSDTNLQEVKVILPQEIYDNSSLRKYGIDKKTPVYLQGWIHGDFFVKTDLKSSRIYPMFWNKVPENIGEWEVDEA